MKILLHIQNVHSHEVFDVILLGFLGGAVAEQPFIIVSQFATLGYFILLFI